MHARSARTLFDRLAAALCALALALGLVPLAPASAVAEEHGDEPAAASVGELLNAGAYREGEALVVYRADEGPARSRSLDAADPLAYAGFSVAESWDFSGAGAAAAVSTFSLDESTGEGADQDDAAVVARVTKPGATTAALLEELRAMDGVLAAAPNYVHESIGAVEPDGYEAGLPSIPPVAPVGETHASEQPVVAGTEVFSVNEGTQASTTNDPLSALQWALDNDIVSDSGIAANSDVSFSSVCAQATQGVENIVAVLDSGVDYGNEDLRGAMWENPGDIPGVPGRAGTHGFDFIDGDDEPLPENNSFEESHGTHCAGIVAATSDNETGIAGVSPKTKIMALRTNGASTGGNTYDSSVLAAYEYLLHAKLAGQNVVAANNSWSGAISPVTEYAMNQAGRAGVLTVFAAGNNDVDAGSVDNNRITYGLSGSPYILSVAATLPQGKYATYTNYNKSIVDVAAPGSVILSTVARGAQSFLPAAAKLQDKADGAAGVRSLYYHNMTDFAQADSGAHLVLYGQDRMPAADQSKLSASTGSGLDGRRALKITVDGMTKYEGAAVTWRIANPFRDMSWERAREVRVSALPGLSAFAGGGDGEPMVFAAASVIDERGNALTSGEASYGSFDNQSLGYARFTDEESFNRIKDQDTVRVGVDLLLLTDTSGEGSTSLTVTDFGMGFVVDDQAYDYRSGTSMACPLVAGAIGLLASLHPEDSALDLRGRIVGGTKASNLASDQVKQTASNGTLDLSVANGDAVNPNTWDAREGVDAQGSPALVIEGYALDRATQLAIDGVAVDGDRWETSADGSHVVVRDASLLDGARHSVVVGDGAAKHQAVYTFPKAEQRLSFERVADLPDPGIPGEAGFDSGLLIAASDRLFCLDSKGRYLYSYDPDSADGWTACAPPSGAGFDGSYFRANGAAAYADGKLYLTVLHDGETGDPEKPYVLFLGMVSYDIATDAWSDEVVDFLSSDPGGAGRHFAPVGLASCDGLIYVSVNSRMQRRVVEYDPATGDGGVIDIVAADPTGTFGSLASGRTAPLVAIGDQVRFVGFVPEGDGYAMALGTFDGETFGIVEPGADAPRFGSDELDALEGYARQAAAATGDSIVFAGASADGLGDTYAVDAATGAWRSLGVKAPGGGSAAVATACFYRGEYYVLAASEGPDGRPTTSLYRLPDEVELMPNDHVASAQAAEGGKVKVSYDALAAPAARTAGGAAGSAASARVEHVALGDAVTWTAVPDEGYAFAGWYGQDGALVDEEAIHRQPVTADVSLIARFVAVELGPGPGPGPGPAPGGGSEPPLPTTPQAQPDPKPLVSTGDGAFAAAAVVALSAAGLVCALTLAVRRRRVGR